MVGAVDEQCIGTVEVVAGHTPGSAGSHSRSAIGDSIGAIREKSIGRVVESVGVRGDGISSLIVMGTTVNPDTPSEVDGLADVDGLGRPVEEVFDLEGLCLRKSTQAAIVIGGTGGEGVDAVDAVVVVDGEFHGGIGER